MKEESVTSKTLNGGFISHYTNAEVALKIHNCRLIGDGQTTGTCVRLSSIKTIPVSFSMIDTEILNTNSTISLNSILTDRSIDFIRVNVQNTSFEMRTVNVLLGHILFMNCVLDQTYHLSNTQSVSASFLYAGTTFTGAVTTREGYHVSVTTPTRHLIFQQCIFTGCSTAASSIIQASSISSLTVDSSSFTNCFGAHTHGVFRVMYTRFLAHSCIFTNVSAKTANILYGLTPQSLFLENCHFDLPASNVNDFLLSDVGQMELLNESSIVGCTSNRPITANYQSTKIVCPFFTEVTTEPETNKMRVGTWPEDEDFSEHSSLSVALATLSDDSLLPNIVFLSEGSHSQTSLIEIKHEVEIVGSRSNTSNFHCTELTTAGFKPKSGGKLTLRSMKLIPSTSSATLVEMDEDVNLLLTRTFVDGVSGHTVSLMLLSLGTTRIAHSTFQNIKSEEALLSVSGSASLTISDTYFITITRTSPEPSSVGTTPCGSCVEGMTSGDVKILFSRFGVCSTNGRAGAIDLMKADGSSSVEMEWNKFDQNLAGTDVDSKVKGDDVVVKDFDESQLNLNLETQQSFPSAHTFLIDSSHPIIPPPGLFSLTGQGPGGPLAWADINIMNSNFLSDEMSLQSLLGSRLHNNVHSSISTDFEYRETMTPFTCQNSSTSVDLWRDSLSIITIKQTGVVFCHLINSTLKLKNLKLSFVSLEASAFDVDSPSSLTLDTVTLTVTNTLKAPFVSSKGKSINIHSLKFPATLKLDNTPFIKAHSNLTISSFSYQNSPPPLATLASLNTPFISLEGVTFADFSGLKISGNLGTPIEVSLVKARNTNITFTDSQVYHLQTTADGLCLNADSCNVTIQSGGFSNISARNGGFLYCTNSNITIRESSYTNCSATKGGIVYAEHSKVNFAFSSSYSRSFTSCSAEEGGVAYLISSTLQIEKGNFISNSAKRGGVAYVDLADDHFVTATSITYSTFTNNSATDVDENGVDSGKGGVFFITGTTTATTPLNFGIHRFEGNKANFGNDVFVEKSVLGDDEPTRLSNCGGESHSDFPHLEIENHNTTQDELGQISDFIPFPTLSIATYGVLSESCKWNGNLCKTLIYALQFLRTTDANGLLYPRRALQESDITTEPIVLETQDLFYSSEKDSRWYISLSATHDLVENTIFTIEDESRLTLERMNLFLKSKHHAVKLTSKEGSLVIDKSTILCAAATTTVSPIWSIGNCVGLNNVTFKPSVYASTATLSAPLVSFTPKPSNDDELGSGSFEMTNTNLTNLTFEKTTMIKVETTGDVTFTTPKLTNVISDQQTGKYLRLKGQNFRTQLKPEQWDDSLKTPTHVASLWGEDISMKESEKWRRGSLVYWLVSPSSEVVIGLDDDADDHPNCGSSTFKCTTLDSAFASAELNSIDTLSFSVSTTLSTPLSFLSSVTLKSFLDDRQTITFDNTSLMKVDTPLTTLSLTSLIFTIAESCSSATLFVVEKGEMTFSSCLIGSSDSSSPQVVPATTTKLIEVKSDGTLILNDTLIQHITFTHATHGTALHLHADSTLSFTGTTTVGEISSLGRGSHVVISSSAGLDSTSISSLASQIEAWGPTTTNGARFTESEINEFVVIDSNGEVEELIYSWYPYDDLTLFVDRSGGSHSKCGLYVLPCSSISENANKVGAGEAIVVSSDLTETVGFTSSKALSVKSSDYTKQVLSIASTASFTTQTSPLSFTSISFIPLPQTSNQNTNTNTRAESLFIVESGSLSLTSCSVSSFELYSSPLITHTSGTLALRSCSLSSITRSTGNGTVLNTEMKTGKSLLLDEIEFSLMLSSKDSPILALSFPPFDESNPDPLFDFTLTNLAFTNMTGMESEPPCFISLVGHDLASWIEVHDDRFENSYSDDLAISDLWSVDETHNLSASLLFYLVASSGPVGVSDSGYEMAKCGSNSVWCSTIELSLTRLSAQNTKKVLVMNEVTLSTSIALPNELTFAGNPNALSACVVSAAGSFVSEDIDFTTISKLTFSLPSTQTAEAVIVHSSTRLTLSTLELSSTSESSARFLKVTAGKAEMSEIEIRSETASDSIRFWILGGTVTASQFHVESGIAPNGTIVRVEGGSLSLTGMTAKSPKPIEGRLFFVTNAVLNVTDMKLTKLTFTNALLELCSFGESAISDMNISECSGWTILTARDGDSLTIRNSVFSSLIAPAGLNDADSSDLCIWERSLIEIANTPTSLSHSNLLHIPQGAISISNSPLSLTGCIFSGNSPSSVEWPSLRRNVKCTNGAVSITGIGGGDGLSSPHLWIWTSECSVRKDDELEHSPLFVPTLSNKSSSTFDNKQKEFSVKIVGTMMIPCGLSLEVFEAGFESKSNSGQPLHFEISSLSPSKWTETELSFVLPQSSLTELDKKLDHRCRLVFGDGQITDSFSLIGKGKGNMSQAGIVTTIVAPIVFITVAIFLVFLIVLCVLSRRRNQKKDTNDDSEMNIPPEPLKYELIEPDETVKPLMGSMGNNSLLMVSGDKKQDEHKSTLASSILPFKEVEAVRCDGKEGVVQVDPRNTLFHRLHVDKKVDFDKKRMGVQIVTGLKRMLMTSPFSEVLTRLSPHWIILDQTNNVLLRIDDLPNQISLPNQTAASQSKNGEDRRWNAPEQDTEEGEESNMISIDRSKVSVFRLGLVLWELETELVPFGELDAVNASRQMKAGVMPLIHNWADESFADLVRECLSLAPDDRPSLDVVQSRLESHCSNPPPPPLNPPKHDKPIITISGDIQN
ncbi:hypothetical protein BLNAU_14692 [Blattamonas nauphoetae]|uniref:Protein kinase domain-containing protein n=1 Tax=Blattamonas nauphoetae TaxID=2049346 RepID=A0ABQ9XG86_9EUKA|nr:hypothetical protein BLNAU_14692 [Blattamonas nauphoetae]